MYGGRIPASAGVVSEQVVGEASAGGGAAEGAVAVQVPGLPGVSIGDGDLPAGDDALAVATLLADGGDRAEEPADLGGVTNG